MVLIKNHPPAVTQVYQYMLNRGIFPPNIFLSCFSWHMVMRRSTPWRSCRTIQWRTSNPLLWRFTTITRPVCDPSVSPSRSFLKPLHTELVVYGSWFLFFLLLKVRKLQLSTPLHVQISESPRSTARPQRELFHILVIFNGILRVDFSYHRIKNFIKAP